MFEGFKKDTLIIKQVLGLGLLGYLILLMGLIQTISTPIIIFFLCLCIIVGVFFIKKKKLFDLTFYIKIRDLNKIEKIIMSIIFIVSLISVFEVLAPSTSGDALTYHFRIPFDYVFFQKVKYFESALYNMPHLIQIIYVIPFSLGANDIGSHLINYYICILFFILIFKMLSSFFDRQTALITILIIILLPMFTFIKVSGRVEVGLTLFFIFGVYTLLNFLNKKKISWLVLSAIFFGYACSVKYTALIFFVPLYLYLLFYSLIKLSSKNYQYIKYFFIFSFFCILFSSPFYIKNYIMTGNPLYPYFYEIFGGKDWSNTLVESAKLHFESIKKPAGQGFLDFLKSPWILTMEGEKFISGKNGYGFLYLTFLPILMTLGYEHFKQNKCKIFIPKPDPLYLFTWLIFLMDILFIFSFHRGRHLFIIFVILSIYLA